MPGRLGRFAKRPARINNFGDLLGPAVVRSLVPIGSKASRPARRLLTVGSIAHFAQDGDVVWGTGVNGKIPITAIVARDLDVRAVRGPRTAQVLSDLGISVPEVYGDPGLLAPGALGIKRATVPDAVVAAIPNLHDFEKWRDRASVVDPCQPIRSVIEQIAKARAVVASSLHGLVIADALGVPSAWVASASEPRFKYLDYYEGTNQHGIVRHSSLDEALEALSNAPRPRTDGVIAAFPIDLWELPHATSAHKAY
ncbi:polysaccharide pyruvyl transferase family protein [Demequina sp. SYSU T00192]|uniref:Polysaccharide pyruvyl transferase family protein n=1 Tax=Demequina litoralis TaxID=3051660 RepID=A0ABT8G8H1_9MICO|nr:polysaccharide pyruvyl transferase family protein [Demequina sp. SYSU T00192]MDN4475431.1 polysaccharide pyruvyl transferase family protein [Demequina sp. SYSU T00192]